MHRLLLLCSGLRSTDTTDTLDSGPRSMDSGPCRRDSGYLRTNVSSQFRSIGSLVIRTALSVRTVLISSRQWGILEHLKSSKDIHCLHPANQRAHPAASSQATYILWGYKIDHLYTNHDGYPFIQLVEVLQQQTTMIWGGAPHFSSIRGSTF